MDYVFSSRRRSGSGFGDEPGPTRFLKVPNSAKDTKTDHQVPKTDWIKEVMEAAKPGSASAQSEGDILIHVHGFNTDSGDMLARHRALRKGLEAQGFKGVVVSYDWPSKGKTLNYLEDRTDAKMTALSLVRDGISTFAALQRPDCLVNVHVLAHSMGAYVVREAFDDADDRPAVTSRAWTVSQLMLVAADISSSSMDPGNPKSSSLYRRSIRVTNYYNPLDEILSISSTKRVGVAPRLGRIGLAHPLDPKAVNVYCGAYYRDNRDSFAGGVARSHGWYFESEVFFQDVMLTVAGEIDRAEFPTRRQTDKSNMALVAPDSAPPAPLDGRFVGV